MLAVAVDSSVAQSRPRDRYNNSRIHFIRVYFRQEGTTLTKSYVWRSTKANVLVILARVEMQQKYTECPIHF